MYCDMGARQGMGCIAKQSLCPRHGQAGRTGERGAGRAGGVRRRGAQVLGAGRRWVARVHGRWALGRWARGTAQARAGGAGWAKLGHCATDPILTQFLDLILFLSQFMDTVHEPGS